MEDVLKAEYEIIVVLIFSLMYMSVCSVCTFSSNTSSPLTRCVSHSHKGSLPAVCLPVYLAGWRLVDYMSPALFSLLRVVPLSPLTNRGHVVLLHAIN